MEQKGSPHPLSPCHDVTPPTALPCSLQPRYNHEAAPRAGIPAILHTDRLPQALTALADDDGIARTAKDRASDVGDLKWCLQT